MINNNPHIIDKLVTAYNAQNARAFADFFTEDAIHGTLHAPLQQRGREEIYQRYLEVFAQFPQNHTTVVHRTAFGAFVIDHEVIRRSPDAVPFNVVAIYTFESEAESSVAAAHKSSRITRCDFIREQ